MSCKSAWTAAGLGPCLPEVILFGSVAIATTVALTVARVVAGGSFLTAIVALAQELRLRRASVPSLPRLMFRAYLQHLDQRTEHRQRWRTTSGTGVRPCSVKSGAVASNTAKDRSTGRRSAHPPLGQATQLAWSALTVRGPEREYQDVKILVTGGAAISVRIRWGG